MRHFISILIALLTAGAVYAEPVAIRFSFWGNEMRFDAIEQAVSLYERVNPDVRIILDEGSYSDSRQSLQIMMTEGSMPDIVAYDYKWTGEIDDRLFVDLRSLDSLDFSDIPVEIIKDFSILDGRLIGMPLGLNGLGLVYNRSFFEKFALSNPDLWDWDDIIENEGERRKKLLKNNECDDIWGLRRKGIRLPILYLVIDKVITVMGNLRAQDPKKEKEFNQKLKILISELPFVGIRLIFIPHRATGLVDKTNRAMLQFIAAVRSARDEIEEGLGVTKWYRGLTKPGDMAIKM